VAHVDGPAEMGGLKRLSGVWVAGGWADLGAVPRISLSWAHSGLVATDRGELVGFHAGQLVVFSPGGGVVRTIESDLTEGHGMTLVRDGDGELLWLCDPGFHFARSEDEGDEGLATMFGKGLRQVRRDPRVVKVTLDGRVLLELPIPAEDGRFLAGPSGTYCPCGTAVNEERFGGQGDIWVADGYGSSLVHRFDRDGSHLSVLSGEEGAGRFNCPHAVYIDRRPGKAAELYVADRGNRRVQVYDLDGRYKRTFGDDFLNSPSGFAQWGDWLVVAELFGRVAVLDSNDVLVGWIGADPDCHAEQGWPARPGWPNAVSDDGFAEAPTLSDAGRFNSPHSVAVDADGNLYVSEWMIGGRYSKVTSA
jgi:hypothetical protein